MINRVVLVGRLTKDPELRYTSNNIAVATFTLAVNRAFSRDNQQEADFLNCVVWRAQAENVSKYLSKGSLAGVDGRIQTRNYEAQDGTRRYVTEIVCDSVRFLESRSSSSRNEFQNEFNQGQSTPSFNQMKEDTKEDPFASSSSIEINDDDLPF